MSDSDELDINRALWADINQQFTGTAAAAAWDADQLTWGLFGIPETELRVLGDVDGLDVVELGCGTAYISAHLARMGARPVGVDLSPQQLASARLCQQQFGIDFPLLEADAGEVPLPDASCDLVISEYGASVWCDPRRWIPEAARLLRPGGRLVFLANSVLLSLCVPAAGGVAGERLLRPQRGMGKVQWPGGGIEHHTSHGDWIAILRSNGFDVEALHELYAPTDAPDHGFYEIVGATWAQRWPAEDLWSARIPPGQPVVTDSSSSSSATT